MIYAENILICIIIPLILVLFFIRGGANRFVFSFLVGMAASLAAAYISGFISQTAGISSEETAVFISPMIEEVLKFLPILFYLFMFSPRDDRLILTASGIGAGFATFENCCYILSMGASSISHIIVRGLVVGVMHIVTVLTLAFAIVIAKRFNAFTMASCLGALSLAMMFHGLYNLLVSHPGATTLIGYILPVLTAAAIILPYRRYSQSPEED